MRKQKWIAMFLIVMMLFTMMPAGMAFGETTYYVQIFNTVNNYGTTTDMGGSIIGDGNYTAGQEVTLTATPKDGYCAIGWAARGDNGTVIDTVEVPSGVSNKHLSISFTMPAHEVEITGSFYKHTLGTFYTDIGDGTHDSYCYYCGEYEKNPVPHSDLTDYTESGRPDGKCDDCGVDMFSDWEYFTIGNNAGDFFTQFETQNYNMGEYDTQFQNVVQQMLPFSWKATMNRVEKQETSIWGGSCYGIAAVEMLANMKLLDISLYDEDRNTTLPNVEAPSESNDKNIRKLLNYYFLTQLVYETRNTTYYLNTEDGKNEMLAFAEQIAKGKKASFGYSFVENGITYGHAFVVDGGEKRTINDEEYYVLHGYDNRYHDFELVELEERNGTYYVTRLNELALVDVVVTPDGECTVQMYNLDEKGNKVGKDAIKHVFNGYAYTLGPIEEVVTDFEYYMVEDTGYLEYFLPDSINKNITSVESRPSMMISLNGTVDIEDASGNAIADNNSDVHVIASAMTEVSSVTNITGTSEPEETFKANQPASMLVGLSDVSSSYNISDPSGTVDLVNGNQYTALTTTTAASATINTVTGGVSLTANNGDFDITVTCGDGRYATVTGTAAGDVSVTPTQNGVNVIPADGNYTVTYKSYADTPGSADTSGSGGGFSGKYNYPVNMGDIENAKVTFSDYYAVEGETVTITVTPDAGKQVDEVLVIDKDGDVIPVTKVGDNQYRFTMPKEEVSVYVTTEDAEYDLRIVMQINNKVILVNGRAIHNDVAPVIVDNRTMVPIRVVTELLGGTADWNETDRTVTLNIDGKTLTMTIGQPIPGFGTSAVIMDNRTYVPIRYVAEKLGANVEWIAATQQIVIEK